MHATRRTTPARVDWVTVGVVDEEYMVSDAVMAGFMAETENGTYAYLEDGEYLSRALKSLEGRYATLWIGGPMRHQSVGRVEEEEEPVDVRGEVGEITDSEGAVTGFYAILHRRAGDREFVDLFIAGENRDDVESTKDQLTREFQNVNVRMITTGVGQWICSSKRKAGTRK